MSDEKSQQQTSTESTVAGAAKTGKAISNIAKGAAAGGAHGAAIEAGKSSAKWLIPLIAAVLLPLILVAMLPSIIFGSLLGDGTDSPNGISNDEVLVQNMTAINEGISFILSEGLTDVLERIDSDFASSGCDGKEINNPFGADVVFNANAFVSQYCAHKDTDVASISKEDKPASLGVTIKKSGNYEVQSGQSMSYDFSGIANTSNVALNHFFWHDRIPTDATRALSISTGTYNARLYYKVTFKTNLNDYRTLASNLLTSNNYSLSLNAATLRLAQGEYVTDVRFEFGTVPSGFSSVVKPTMRVQVLGTVSNGYQIINRADVGGQYLNEWQTAKTTWVTTVRRFNTTPLPKTGY